MTARYGTGTVRHTRRSLLAILVALLVGSVTAAGYAPVGAAMPYDDEENRFAFEIADGYERVQPRVTAAQAAAVVGLWRSEDGGASFNVVREGVPSGTSDVAYAQSNVRTLERRLDYNERGRDFLRVNGEERPRLEYTTSDNAGERYTVRQLFFVTGETAWVLTFTARLDDFDRYERDGTAMMESFTTR